VVKHYNPSISEDAARILNSKQGQFLGDDVQGPVAVIPIRRYANIVRRVGSTTTGSATVYTTPADKDFYLTGIQVSFIKNATCDVASGPLRYTATVEGVSQGIISLALLTLTAQDQNAFVSFETPIKVDRNTAITTSNTFTAGAFVRECCITGYTVETTK